MHTVDNKFKIAQEVFLITERRVRIEDKRTCDVCLGVGTVTYKGYEMNCPKCHGRREIVLDSKPTIIHSVEDKPYRIVSYRYTVCKDGEFLKYRINQGYGKGESVTEDMIFADREEAVKVCNELNMFDRYDEWGKQLLEEMEE